MRLFLILWLTPISFLATWYGLAVNDLSFGLRLFSRETHDLVFAIYGQALGIAPESLPPLILRALLVDSLFVLAVIGYRKRAVLVPWVKERVGRLSGAPKAPRPEDAQVLPAE